MNVVIKANDDLVEKIRNHYLSEIDFNSKIPHTKFVVSSKDLKIIAYQTNKIMFQGNDASSQAQLWQNNIQVKQNNESCYIYLQNQEHIGSDEVGTGDYFGPVVVCASYVNQDIIKKIAHLNIQDSKKIDDEMIMNIASELIKIVPYFVYTLDNPKYNEATIDNNANAIKAKMHNYCLSQLLKMIKIKPLIIVDQFCSPSNYYNYLKDTKTIVKDIHFETKAESKYLAVAIASIIARYTFLNAMDKLSIKVGFNLQKGASDKVDTQASEIVLKNDLSILNDIAKVHFANTNKIKKKIGGL